MFLQKFFGTKQPDTTHLPFIACFCEDENQLSQWRAYSDPSGRYSFRLPMAYLVDIATTHTELARTAISDPGEYWSFSLVKVVYDDKEKQTTARLVVQAIDEFVQNNALDVRVPGVYEALVKFFQTVVMQFAVMFKHQSFMAESEWRLVCIYEREFLSQSGFPGMPFCFRPGPFGLTPYIEIDMNKHGSPNHGVPHN